MEDLYELMGVPRDAKLTDIRSAYRRKAVQLHPDKGGDAAAFSALQKAYSVLSHADKREHYDKTGRIEMTPEEMLRSAMSGGVRSRQGPPHDAKPSGPPPPASAWSSPPPPKGPAPPRAASPPPPEDDRAKTLAKPESAVWLPPALRAAVEGRELQSIEVPPGLDVPVPHVVVSGSEDALTLVLQSVPAFFEEPRLREGEVLVQMHAAPICLHELGADTDFKVGDTYGMQGIGQVRLVGPMVDQLQVGDWVLPLREVDDDGDLREDALPPGTARALAVLSATRCARLSGFGEDILTAGQMAVLKSIGVACYIVDDHSKSLARGDTVIINAANGVVGQLLVQMLSALGYSVFAVVRKHNSIELTKRYLETLGAIKALLDDDNIKGSIENLDLPLPMLALDGIGGEATVRIASALAKTGNLVCYGSAKHQVLPSGWGKKWKGTNTQFSLDEFLQEDLPSNSESLSKRVLGIARMLQAGQLKLKVEEYPAEPEEFAKAVQDAQQGGRNHAVALCFEIAEVSAGGNAPAVTAPVGKTGTSFLSNIAAAATVAGLKGASGAGGAVAAGQMGKPPRGSWDLDFLEWEEGGEEQAEKRKEDEGNLFQPDPMMDEMRIQPYVDDAIAAPVALELGAKAGHATAVLIWLPGAGEVPEEHGPWLSQLASRHPGLRVLALRPKVGTQWYDTSDNRAVQLGLRFGVVDDLEENPDGKPSLSGGEIMFPSLEQAEIEALQQVESAALGVARRCVLEEKSLSVPRSSVSTQPLPFFLGGFGQGGAVALYTAICLLQAPVQGVAFSHSGVPAASMLGKRMSEQIRRTTKLYAVYDREDKDVPFAYAEALHRMLRMVGCDTSLDWLEDGNGHEFFDDAAARVSERFAECMRPVFRKQMEAEASRKIKERQGFGMGPTMDPAQQLQQQRQQQQQQKPLFKPMWEMQEH